MNEIDYNLIVAMFPSHDLCDWLMYSKKNCKKFLHDFCMQKLFYNTNEELYFL